MLWLLQMHDMFHCCQSLSIRAGPHFWNTPCIFTESNSFIDQKFKCTWLDVFCKYANTHFLHSFHKYKGWTTYIVFTNTKVELQYSSSREIRNKSILCSCIPFLHVHVCFVGSLAAFDNILLPDVVRLLYIRGEPHGIVKFVTCI